MQAAGLGRPHPGTAAFREAPLTGRSLGSSQSKVEWLHGQGCAAGLPARLKEGSKALPSAQDRFIPDRVDYSQATQAECVIAVHL